MKNIVILTGGTGLERDIALQSAETFKKYLKRDHDTYVLPEEMGDFLENKDEYEFAIPVFHGEYGEDGKIFAFLDSLGIPHTFSDYKTHALCLDKEKTNTLVYQLGIKVPFQYIAKTNESFPESYPVIMKPNQGGSSFHTYKIDNNQEFYDSFNKTRADITDDILIQEFVAGEEYSVPVVDGEVLPIMKLEKENDQVFDYDAKYVSEEVIKEIFPEIEQELFSQLQKQSLDIYKYFNIKGMCRIDYLVLNNEVYFLEVNTIPGMTEGSILPKAWGISGKKIDKLIQTVIEIK